MVVSIYHEKLIDNSFIFDGVGALETVTAAQYVQRLCQFKAWSSRQHHLTQMEAYNRPVHFSCLANTAIGRPLILI